MPKKNTKAKFFLLAPRTVHFVTDGIAVTATTHVPMKPALIQGVLDEVKRQLIAVDLKSAKC